MKNLKPLSKAEMKKVTGGDGGMQCLSDNDCPSDVYCVDGYCGVECGPDKACPDPVRDWCYMGHCVTRP